MPAVLRFLAPILGLWLSIAPGQAGAADPLPTLRLDAAGTTVSGLSSGAYMAVQLHVAHSKSIAGAGVVAGGPYLCAEGQLATALNSCMKTFLGPPDAAALFARAEALVKAGHVDPFDGLAGDRVYLFSGTEDTTVTPPVMAAARAFYRLAGIAEQDIKYLGDVAAGHAFIVEEATNSCAVTGTPFINDCDYDQAGDILQHLYGTLAAPVAADADRLLTFDQSAFLPGPQGHSMAASGFVYIPAACAAGEICRLHIAFAGCRQTPDHIGDLFARTTGYNRWAESNRLVVLYPQAITTGANPHGCWDWWGYSGPAYHTQSGPQVAAIAAMAARLGAPFAAAPAPAFCARHDSWNWTHWFADRAVGCGWASLCAVGSGDPVGFFYETATLHERPEGHFSTIPCTP